MSRQHSTNFLSILNEPLTDLIQMSCNILASHFFRAYQDLLTAESENTLLVLKCWLVSGRKSFTLENKLCVYELYRQRVNTARGEEGNCGLVIASEVGSHGHSHLRPFTTQQVDVNKCVFFSLHLQIWLSMVQTSPLFYFLNFYSIIKQ